MPDRSSEWEAYRLKRRSEPTPPYAAAPPATEVYSPAAVWASSMYAEDERPGDLAVRHTSPHRREHALPSPAGSKTRPILLAVAGVTVLAVLIAAPVVSRLAGWSSRTPSQPPPGGTATTPARSRVSPAIAGPGCRGGAYKRVGHPVAGKGGWLSGSGGFSGAGCGGRFDALPVSGDAKRADPGLFAQWTFDPRSGRRCTVALYIPKTSDKTLVGGRPAHYSIRQKKGDRRLLSFRIDQPRSTGRWVSSAAFTVDGPFSVRLANTGENRTGNTHVAAAQARARCS